MTEARQADLLTTGEIARRLGVHPSTVRRWSDAGVLQAERLPGAGHRRFAPAEVQRARQRAGRGGVERRPAHTMPRLQPGAFGPLTAIDGRRPGAPTRPMGETRPAGPPAPRPAPAALRVVVDATALVALALATADEHAAACRVAERLESDRAVVMTSVEAICEAHRLLGERAGAPAANRWLVALQRAPVGIVAPSERDLSAARRLVAGASQPLATALLFAAGARLGARCSWSYDRAAAWFALVAGFEVVN